MALTAVGMKSLQEQDEPNGQDSAPVGERPTHEDAEKQLATTLERHRVWLETNRADGVRAGLAGSRLNGLSLWRADLREADLEGADLRGADLDHAVLRGAQLRGARLTGASLWRADLSGADLAAADLTCAKLDHAVLRSAVLRGADLGGASLWEARLEGADLRDVVGLTAAQLEPAFRDRETRLPAFSSEGASPENTEAGYLDAGPDERRSGSAREASEFFRQLATLTAEEEALRRRREELEGGLFAASAVGWHEVVQRARYLITLLAATPTGQDLRRRRMIADVLDDLDHLSNNLAKPDQLSG